VRGYADKVEIPKGVRECFKFGKQYYNIWAYICTYVYIGLYNEVLDLLLETDLWASLDKINNKLSTKKALLPCI
jgi:hypothetical protein